MLCFGLVPSGDFETHVMSSSHNKASLFLYMYINTFIPYHHHIFTMLFLKTQVRNKGSRKGNEHERRGGGNVAHPKPTKNDKFWVLRERESPQQPFLLISCFPSDAEALLLGLLKNFFYISYIPMPPFLYIERGSLILRGLYVHNKNEWWRWTDVSKEHGYSL